MNAMMALKEAGGNSMGLEAECKVSFAGKTCLGRAQLETSELMFRGEFRLKIPLKAIQSMEAKHGRLRLEWPEGQATFELGESAEKWLLKIRYPKSRLEKLGVKEGMRVALVGVTDEDFLAELAVKLGDIVKSQQGKEMDLIFFGLENPEELQKLPALRERLAKAGAIWTLYPKGRKDIPEKDVRAAGNAAGLVDTKVVGFSQTLTAVKWVIPVAKRK